MDWGSITFGMSVRRSVSQSANPPVTHLHPNIFVFLVNKRKKVTEPDFFQIDFSTFAKIKSHEMSSL